MSEGCTNKRNESQPRDRGKNNKDHACRLKARIERISQNLTTLLDLCNNASRGIWTNNVSRRDGETRPLAEAGHQTRPLAEAKHQATEQGKRLAPKLDETWVQKHHETLGSVPQIRELMESSQPENKTLLRVPRLHKEPL